MIAKLAILLGLVAIVYLWWRRRAVAASAMRPAEARSILQLTEQRQRRARFARRTAG